MQASQRPLLQRIGVSSAWLLLARLAAQALTVVFTILVARYLGQAGLGEYAFVAAVVFAGNVLSTFGMDTLLIREIASRRTTDLPLLPAALWGQLGLASLFIAGVLLFTGAAGPEADPVSAPLRVYSLSLLPLAFFTVFSAVLRGYERMDLVFLLSLGSAALQAAAAATAALTEGNLLTLTGLLLGAQVLAAFLAAVLCGVAIPGFRLRLGVPLTALASALRRGWPLAVLGILGVVYGRMGIYALASLTDAAVTGGFAAAARVVEALKLGHYAVLGAAFPVLSLRVALGERSPESGGGLTRNISIGLFSLSVSASLLAVLLAGPLVGLLFGPGFEGAAPALRIMVWSLVPYTYTAITSLKLVAGNREMTVTRVLAGSTAVAAALHLVLIPALGLRGAALATLGSECLQAGLFYLVQRRRLFDSRPGREKRLTSEAA